MLDFRIKAKKYQIGQTICSFLQWVKYSNLVTVKINGCDSAGNSTLPDSAVPDSAEKNTALSRTALRRRQNCLGQRKKNTALSRTAQRRTQHCPGQRREEHSTVPDSAEKNTALSVWISIVPDRAQLGILEVFDLIGIFRTPPPKKKKISVPLLIFFSWLCRN